MNRLNTKFIEVLSVVMPFVILVMLIHFTLVPLGNALFIAFLWSAAIVIVGLSFFLVGVDLGITPLGMRLGPLVGRSRSIVMVIAAATIIGFFISYAEPALLVMANQVSELTQGLISALVLNVTVSVGIGVLVALGFIRVFYKIPLYLLLWGLYALVFLLAMTASPQLLAIAFDASGVTTGVLAVPFLLSLSLGLTFKNKDSKASEKDSFGMIAIASVGAILAVLVLGKWSNPVFQAMPSLPSAPPLDSVTDRFSSLFGPMSSEALISITPLLVMLLIVLALDKLIIQRERTRMMLGFVYAVIGLALFLLGVNGSFIDVGRLLGSELTARVDTVTLVLIGFVLGVVTIVAEPAVAVLTHQVEAVTSGYIGRLSVTIALALGVGLAIALSVIRILVPQLQLWHLLLPGYSVALLLTLRVPKLFVGIAFDAGGVATGPMISSLVMAFVHGIASSRLGADILIDGFGMVALVALMPILSLLILGWFYKLKTKGRVNDENL